MTALKRILIVDDEPDILEFLSYNFKKNGYSVLTACNGSEGILLAHSEAPDVVISDLLMPGTDGAEMCTEMKRRPELKHIPVLILSAMNDDYKVLYAMSAGADQYAVKPVRFEYLLRLVQDVFYEKVEFFAV